MKFKTLEEKREWMKVHYPRDPKTWDLEKNEIRELAYTAAHLYGPKMATMFHIKQAKCDLAICGMIIRPGDADYKDKAHAWTDLTGQLHVPCAECYNHRAFMENPTAKPEPGEMPFDDAYEAELEEADKRALARDLEPRDGIWRGYTENEVDAAIEFWGEWPKMEKIVEHEDDDFNTDGFTEHFGWEPSDRGLDDDDGELVESGLLLELAGCRS